MVTTDPPRPPVDPGSVTDVVRSVDLRRLAAALDLPEPTGGHVPPLWHWIAFQDRVPTALLGEDGHPRIGGIVVDPPYPRRMFAGVRVTCSGPLPTDVPITRTAAVGEFRLRRGRSGPMAFVTVVLRYAVDGRELVREEQDLVYLPGHPPGAAVRREGTTAPADAPADGAAVDGVGVTTGPRRTRSFGPMTLFRFSALTFNTHRIHYDEPYATGVEGYPGLVVHGPLLAIQLAELVRAADRATTLVGFAFRARSPAFADQELAFETRPATPDEIGAASGGTPEADAVVGLTARRGGTVLATASARLRSDPA